jgi:hypothetical protein
MPDIERVRAEHERLRAEPPEEDRAHRRAEAELRAENERLRAILDGADAEAVRRGARELDAWSDETRREEVDAMKMARRVLRAALGGGE